MPKLFKKELLEKLLLYFIVLQPILDILTYFSLRALDTSLTIGIVVRVLFMGLSLWFIFFGNSSKLKKYVLWYLIAIAVVFGIGLVYNFFAKPIFNPFLELQFIAKTVYFHVMLGSYLLLFTSIDKVSEKRMQILKYTSIAMLIISISMFIAILTGTSSETYEWNKFGMKGWFHSGNELGSIVAVCFPLIYLYALLKMEEAKKIYYFIPVVLLASVAILIGTKVGYFAVLLAAVIVFVTYVIYWIIQKRKKVQDPLLRLRLIFSFVFLIALLAVTPFSPTFTNVSGDMGAIEEQQKEQQEKNQEDSESEFGSEDPSAEEEPSKEEETQLMDSPILVIILSARNLYFTEMYNYYVEADPVQKMFGMGYAGNYESPEDRKLIEMDFFDLFFSYGILGIILILLPFLTIIGLFLKLLFQTPGTLLHPLNMLILLSIGFGTGIAFLAGHVLYAPAVSIYLAISIVLLIINMLKMNKDVKEAKTS
ncbi:O-antigen ligase family protein [Halobacillus sp. SY10]|uniref:O-antigen ligase family protein n=1 Tax=Halobacillus sp. SY10 TaxID=3381356 RepID=UPI0038798909